MNKNVDAVKPFRVKNHDNVIPLPAQNVTKDTYMFTSLFLK